MNIVAEKDFPRPSRESPLETVISYPARDSNRGQCRDQLAVLVRMATSLTDVHDHQLPENSIALIMKWYFES